MDEPLSNLDAKLRVQLRNELKKMQKDFGITTIYVTHDQEEALTLSDRIAVFNKGCHRADRHAERNLQPLARRNLSATSSATSTAVEDIVDVPTQMRRGGRRGRTQLHPAGARCTSTSPSATARFALDGVVESIEYYGLYIKYYINVGSQIFKVIEKNDGVNIYDAGREGRP